MKEERRAVPAGVGDVDAALAAAAGLAAAAAAAGRRRWRVPSGEGDRPPEVEL